MKAKRSVVKITLAALVLTLGTPLMAAPQDQSSTEGQRGQLSSKDYKFLSDAARAQTEEVELGQMAKDKGVNQAVRSYGDHMVADHTKGLEELKQLAAQKGAVLPTQMSHSERSTTEKLQNAAGADFDKEYAKAMYKDHKKDVKEFEKASKDVIDPDLRAWADKTLPILQQHLSMAEQLETQVKSEK